MATINITIMYSIHKKIYVIPWGGLHMKNPLPLNTNGGRGFLASTPHMVLHNTMWGVDAKNLLPLLVLSIVIIFPKFADVYLIVHL